MHYALQPTAATRNPRRTKHEAAEVRSSGVRGGRWGSSGRVRGSGGGGRGMGQPPAARDPGSPTIGGCRSLGRHRSPAITAAIAIAISLPDLGGPGACRYL
jgi:hypothetical protein